MFHLLNFISVDFHFYDGKRNFFLNQIKTFKLKISNDIFHFRFITTLQKQKHLQSFHFFETEIFFRLLSTWKIKFCNGDVLRTILAFRCRRPGFDSQRIKNGFHFFFSAMLTKDIRLFFFFKKDQPRPFVNLFLPFQCKVQKISIASGRIWTWMVGVEDKDTSHYFHHGPRPFFLTFSIFFSFTNYRL